MAKTFIPVIKAWNRVFDLLKCVNTYPYDREGFENSVLALYPGKSTKSVFRGMAIPTLRSLGLILGYNDVIRISANGALTFQAFQVSQEEGLRALRLIQYELDTKIGMINHIEELGSIQFDKFIKIWIDLVEITRGKSFLKKEHRDRAARERIVDWTNFLNFSGLLYNNNQSLYINTEKLMTTKNDANSYQQDKEATFRKLFFRCYRRIVAEQGRINTVEIELLRKELALAAYEGQQILITERQFDELLGRIPKTTSEYTITFGRSMGADEKLFHYQNQFFQTIFIRFYSDASRGNL